MNNITSQFKYKLKKVLPDIKILGQYKNTITKILVEDNLKIQYEVFPESLLRGCYPKITSAINLQDAFYKKLKIKHPNLLLISKYKGANSHVIVQDELGIKYSVVPGFLLSSKSKPSIKAAVDKTDAFKKIVYHRRSDCEILGDYKGDKVEILLKDKFGIFHKMLPYNITKGNGFTLKSAVDKTEFISAKLKIHHPELKLVSKYRGANRKITVMDDLGIEYSILFNNLIKSNQNISIKSAIDKSSAINKIIRSVRDDIKSIGNYSSAKEQLIVKDVDGYNHKISIYGLINGNALSFNSVIDKSRYFDFLYKKINNLNYKRKSEFIGLELSIKMTCPDHGDFDSTPAKLLASSKCNLCYRASRVNTLNYFIERANVLHNNKFDYSNSVYNGFNSRIDIICPKHGLFNQLVKGHLSGKGCKKCVEESQTGTLASVSKYNPTLKYKLYKFILWSDDLKEVFGKVGLTLDVKRRIWGIPYNVFVVEVKDGPINALYMEEQNFFVKVKSSKLNYTPKFKFGGYTECYKFNKVEMYNALKQIKNHNSLS
jgi:hypothetical protein